MKNHLLVRVAAIGICGGLAVSLIGCLNAEKTTMVTYDKAKDQFSVLMIYQHIRGDGGEINGLLALYKNRNNLILIPTIQFLNETQTLRLSDDLMAEIDMGSPSADMQAFHSPVWLGGIQIKPGELFLNSKDDLCYAHEVIVPGSVVDDGVKWANQWFRSPDRGNPDGNTFDKLYHAVNVQLDGEISQRSAGKAQMSWKDFTARYIEQSMNSMDRKPAQPAPAQAPATTQPGFAMDPLETTSLEALRHAAEQGKVVLSRSGAEFSLRLPLTPADVAGTISFFTEFRQAVRDKAAQQAAANSDNARDSQLAADLLNAFSVNAVDHSGIQISFDVTAYFENAHLPTASQLEHSPADLAKAATFAAAVAKQVGVNKKLTVDEVNQMFLAGQFAEHPQDPAVAPGEGLGAIKPPEQ